MEMWYEEVHFSRENFFVPQYDNKNFLQALRSEDDSKRFNNPEEYNIDAITRLIAAFIAIINPHAFIFCNDEVESIRNRSNCKNLSEVYSGRTYSKNNSERLERRLFIWIKKSWT